MCSQGLKTKRFSGRPHMKNTVLTLQERLFSIIRRLGEEPKRYARNPDRDFTRKRTLTPAVLIYLIVTMDEKKYLERFARAFSEADRYAVGVGIHPAATEAAPVRARRYVSPLFRSPASAKEISRVSTAGRRRFISEIRDVSCG